MPSRREFLQHGLTAATAAALLPVAPEAFPWPSAEARGDRHRPFLMLYDAAIPAGPAFGAAAARHGVPVRAFAGDAGHLFMRAILPRLETRPAPLAGLTAGPTTFCLEYLARPHGLRVVYRVEHTPTRSGRLRHRLMGPEALSDLAVALSGVGDRWPELTAELAAECPASVRANASIELLDLAARHRHGAESIYTWLMAPAGLPPSL